MTNSGLSSFEQIFKEHYAYLVNLAHKMVGDRQEAEDIVQGVFLNIWKKKHHRQVHGTMKSYLSRAVINASYDAIASTKKVIQLTQTSDTDSADATTDNQLALNELQQNLEIAIKKLPAQCQVIFALSRFQGYSSREIAEELGLSKKTVDNQIGIALKKLRQELQEFITLKNALTATILACLFLLLTM